MTMGSCWNDEFIKNSRLGAQGLKSAITIVSEWSIIDFIIVDFDKFGNLLI